MVDQSVVLGLVVGLVAVVALLLYLMHHRGEEAGGVFHAEILREELNEARDRIEAQEARIDDLLDRLASSAQLIVTLRKAGLDAPDVVAPLARPKGRSMPPEVVAFISKLEPENAEVVSEHAQMLLEQGVPDDDILRVILDGE